MRTRASRWRRRTGWLFALAVVAAAGGTAAAKTSGTPAHRYRTAKATMASVDALLHLHATVEPSGRVTLSFGVAGTVATVSANVGQKVSSGQTLATLVPTGLARKVSEAEASLVAAQAAVAADEAAQKTVTTASAPAPAPKTTSPGGSGHSPATSAPTGAPPASSTVTSAQQAVVNAQQASDAAEQVATADVGTAASTCGRTGAATKATSRPGTVPTTKASTKGSTSPPATSPTPAACNKALAAALVSEKALATAQQALTHAVGALVQLLSATAPATPVASPPGAPPAGATSGPAPSSAPVTPHAEAAQLAGDQSALDADRATLVEAQQSLAEAQLTSPTGGTVAAVGVVPGQSVSPGSAAEAVTVLSQGTFVAEANLRVSQVPRVAVGDAVAVSVVGRPRSIRGAVTRIGPVNTSGGDTYPLVVSLPPGTGGLFTGSIAQLAVVAHHASGVLVVPSSAVRTAGAGSYVLCLRRGRPVRAPVSIGVVGEVLTQIRAGLSRGETVVLADLTRPIPKAAGSLVHRLRGAQLHVVGTGT